MKIISTDNLIESPFVIVRFGDYTFGTYSSSKEHRLNGYSMRVTYPNFIQGLTVTKLNGQVNTYTLSLVYAITENDDPNMIEKVFSSVKTSREMILTYGDWNSPSNIYREESALITSVKSNVSFDSSKIVYTVSGVSNSLSLNSALYDFPERTAKPSDIIKELLYNPQYGMQKIFTGMTSRKVVNSNNMIASNDKTVTIPAKASTSVLDYTTYLVEHMSSISNKDSSMVNDSIYQLTIVDDSKNQYGGPYFRVQKIDTNRVRSDADSAWEIDVGYPGKNFVFNFEITNDEAWSILYDYQDKIDQSSYMYRIDNDGKLVTELSPSIIRSRRTGKITERNKSWWTKMTQFPITVNLTIKGIVRPTLIMDYVKLNVLFYGNRHISSGVYVITKQEDKIDAAGYRTTLTLLRVGGE